jgi:hypothetical protein
LSFDILIQSVLSDIWLFDLCNLLLVALGNAGELALVREDRMRSARYLSDIAADISWLRRSRIGMKREGEPWEEGICRGGLDHQRGYRPDILAAWTLRLRM